MAVFLPQARPEVPQNALLNLEPINNAIDGWQRNALLQSQQQMQQKEFGLRERQVATQEKQWTAEEKARTVKGLGQRAAMIDAEKDPARRAAMWKGILGRIPNAGSLTPEELDPMTGPALLAAEAGQWVDPLARRVQEASLAKTQAETAALGKKDAVSEAILGMITGNTPPAQSGQGAPSPVMPQSNPSAPGGPQALPMSGEAVTPNSALVQNAMMRATGPQPEVIQAQAAQTGQAAAGQGMPQPQGDTIQTPWGPMTRDRAMRMGGALMLDPRYATAGKALLDLAQQGGDQRTFGKEASNEIDKKVVFASEGIGRLKTIQSRFNPDFLRIEKQLGMWGRATAEKWGARLSPQQQQELSSYSAFRADSIDNLNQYIKEITGAQMSIQEAQRITQAMPTAGEGVFDGDSPTQFKSKLDAAVQRLMLVQARYTFAQKTGRAWGDIPLDALPGIIQRRTDELQGGYQRQGLKGDDLKRAVQQNLKQEFGI